MPASSVVGLHVSTSITSETARVEDRVEARVTRDVIADGRVAIPAGTKVIGDVTLVERGGKMKDKARLGVRFHTLVLADGDQVPFRTDAIFREGASPGAESARKIGGAAMGGAIIGAIIGGAKGAAIGGATGAAGGGAVVMAGDRNAATLPAGHDRHRSTDVAGGHRRRARAVARTVPFHHPGECRYRTNGRPLQRSSPARYSFGARQLLRLQYVARLFPVEFHGHTACSLVATRRLGCQPGRRV